jgi:uncharacterized protein YacL
MSLSFDQTSVVIGALVGILIGIAFTLSFAYPRIGRAFGKIIACVFILFGTLGLVWGMYVAISGAELPRIRMEPIPIVITSIPQMLGWAGGCLAAGVTALVLSFVGRR